MLYPTIPHRLLIQRPQTLSMQSDGSIRMETGLADQGTLPGHTSGSRGRTSVGSDPALHLTGWAPSAAHLSPGILRGEMGLGGETWSSLTAPLGSAHRRPLASLTGGGVRLFSIVYIGCFYQSKRAGLRQQRPSSPPAPSFPGPQPGPRGQQLLSFLCIWGGTASPQPWSPPLIRAFLDLRYYCPTSCWDGKACSTLTRLLAAH